MQKYLLAQGAVATTASKVKNGHIDATRLYAALRGLSIERLQEIRNRSSKKQGVENDIQTFLRMLETEKNLLMFFPYKFSHDNKYEFESAVEQILNALTSDFQVSMNYRNNVVGDLDTYICFIYEEYIVFAQNDECKFTYVDRVELSASQVYSKLLSYS